ncbi:hypothetical protein [Actinoalloteichus caeruleus]|uniref:hypothetical protein n=1 Tax=Actinoalloteichus cyanogriseus TaxID=2893586 RepID=UPI0004AAF296|nr:hypothetical protein [Actinoalloteichus caeruleus]
MSRWFTLLDRHRRAAAGLAVVAVVLTGCSTAGPPASDAGVGEAAPTPSATPPATTPSAEPLTDPEESPAPSAAPTTSSDSSTTRTEDDAGPHADEVPVPRDATTRGLGSLSTLDPCGLVAVEDLDFQRPELVTVEPRLTHCLLTVTLPADEEVTAQVQVDHDADPTGAALLAVGARGSAWVVEYWSAATGMCLREGVFPDGLVVRVTTLPSDGVPVSSDRDDTCRLTHVLLNAAVDRVADGTARHLPVGSDSLIARRMCGLLPVDRVRAVARTSGEWHDVDPMGRGCVWGADDLTAGEPAVALSLTSNHALRGATRTLHGRPTREQRVTIRPGYRGCVLGAEGGEFHPAHATVPGPHREALTLGVYGGSGFDELCGRASRLSGAVWPLLAD